MERLIIDRFEESTAVCEYGEGKTLNLPKVLLPEGASEGDILCITVDEEATRDRAEYAHTLRKKLFARH